MHCGTKTNCCAIMRTVSDLAGPSAAPRLLSTNSPCRVEGFAAAKKMPYRQIHHIVASGQNCQSDQCHCRDEPDLLHLISADRSNSPNRLRYRNPRLGGNYSPLHLTRGCQLTTAASRARPGAPFLASFARKPALSEVEGWGLFPSSTPPSEHLKNSLFFAIFLSKNLPFGATIVAAEKFGTPASSASHLIKRLAAPEDVPRFMFPASSPCAAIGFEKPSTSHQVP